MRYSIRTTLPLFAAVFVARTSVGAGRPVPERSTRVAVSAAQERDGQSLYRQLCTTCHGREGRGDGPAAIAFNPRPRDFTSPAFWANRTDEQLAGVVKSGLNRMPSFASRMSDSERIAVIRYIRELVGAGTPK